MGWLDAQVPARGDLDLFKPNGDLQWDSLTRGSGANRLVFQQDGNLVIYTASNKPVWWTTTYGLGLTHGVLRLFWGANMGRCIAGEPGALELSGRAGGRLLLVPVDQLLSDDDAAEQRVGTTSSCSGMSRRTVGSYSFIESDGRSGSLNI